MVAKEYKDILIRIVAKAINNEKLDETELLYAEQYLKYLKENYK